MLAQAWITLCAGAVEFTPQERERILGLGPWPMAQRLDPSNAADGDATAIKLGAALFVSKAISGGRNVACATCHDPKRSFQDGKRSARHGRNTPSLLDANQRNWFGWDGATDSLWAASLAPLTARDEMAATPQSLYTALQRDRKLRSAYREVFGDPLADTTIVVNVAKALAAYQATLVSPRTAFDKFRDQLAQPDSGPGASPSAYPLSAQRGLQIFVGPGNCFLCHSGPRLSNGEFADIGRPFFTREGADPGRWGGLKALLASPFNRLGPHSDAEAGHPSDTLTRHVAAEPRNFGEFKVPSLRGLTATAPYFRDGGAKTLHEAVRHYSQLDPRRVHADGVAILKPLNLTPSQTDDLVAFLKSLNPSQEAPKNPLRISSGRTRDARLGEK